MTDAKDTLCVADQGDEPGEADRKALDERWFELTRETMPSLAAERGWPVRFDHCFQRILLDNAVGTKWRDVIAPPAYRNASPEVMRRGLAMGEACIDGTLDLAELNRNSLSWRGKLRD
jgi:hypothetical protein